MREAREVMADLASSGLSPDQLALVMELASTVAAEARPVADEQAQRRRRADRERKRNVRGNPQTSADNADAEASLSPRPPISPEPTPIPPLTGGTFPSLSAAAAQLADEIWQASPQRARRRSGKHSVERAVAAVLRRGAEPEALKAGLRALYASDDYAGQFAKGIHVVIANGMWEAFLEADEGDSRVLGWGDDEWRSALEILAETGRWADACGARPGQPGCKVPSHLLLEAVA